MATKAGILQEKEFAANMTQVMDVMKGIALSSFIRLKQLKQQRFERFVQSFEGFFHIADLTKAKNPFIQAESPTLGILLVTSDESFMGGLNFKVVQQGLELAGELPCEFMITGTKGGAMLKSYKKPYTTFPPVKEGRFYEIAIKIKDYIVKQIQEKKIGKVTAIYAEPLSFSVQQASTVPLLPAHDMYNPELNKDVDPKEKIISESKIDKIMEYLTHIWITNKLYGLFEDNKMAEFAAQSLQLDGSLQNLTEMNKKLKLLFVKTRRELIDSSLREIVSSRLIK